MEYGIGNHFGSYLNQFWGFELSLGIDFQIPLTSSTLFRHLQISWNEELYVECLKVTFKINRIVLRWPLLRIN